MKVQFITSVAIIAPDPPAASRKLYLDTLGLPLEQLDEDYFASEHIPGCKHFGVWPLSPGRAKPATEPRLATRVPVPQASIEFEVANANASPTRLRNSDAGLRSAAPARHRTLGPNGRPHPLPRRPSSSGCPSPLAARPIRSHNLTKPRRAIAGAASRQRRPDAPSRDRMHLITRHHRAKLVTTSGLPPRTGSTCRPGQAGPRQRASHRGSEWARSPRHCSLRVHRLRYGEFRPTRVRDRVRLTRAASSTSSRGNGMPWSPMAAVLSWAWGRSCLYLAVAAGIRRSVRAAGAGSRFGRAGWRCQPVAR